LEKGRLKNEFNNLESVLNFQRQALRPLFEQLEVPSKVGAAED